MVNRSEHSTYITELQLQPTRLRVRHSSEVTPGSANAQTRPTPDRLVTSLPSDGTCAPLDFPERVSRELTQNSSKIKRRDTNIQRNSQRYQYRVVRQFYLNSPNRSSRRHKELEGSAAHINITNSVSERTPHAPLDVLLGVFLTTNHSRYAARLATPLACNTLTVSELLNLSTTAKGGRPPVARGALATASAAAVVTILMRPANVVPNTSVTDVRPLPEKCSDHSRMSTPCDATSRIHCVTASFGFGEWSSAFE